MTFAVRSRQGLDNVRRNGAWNGNFDDAIPLQSKKIITLPGRLCELVGLRKLAGTPNIPIQGNDEADLRDKPEAKVIAGNFSEILRPSFMPNNFSIPTNCFFWGGNRRDLWMKDS